MENTRSATENEEEILNISSVEEGFHILDETVARLSNDGISLEESFKEFEKGMKVLKMVNEKIDRVEKKVKVINGDEPGEL